MHKALINLIFQKNPRVRKATSDFSSRPWRNLPPTWVIHMATHRPVHNTPISMNFLYGFLLKGPKSLWIGVLWAGLRVAMRIIGRWSNICVLATFSPVHQGLFPVVQRFFCRVPKEQPCTTGIWVCLSGWRLALYLCSPSPAFGLRVVAYLVRSPWGGCRWGRRNFPLSYAFFSFFLRFFCFSLLFFVLLRFFRFSSLFA